MQFIHTFHLVSDNFQGQYSKNNGKNLQIVPCYICPLSIPPYHLARSLHHTTTEHL